MPIRDNEALESKAMKPHHVGFRLKDSRQSDAQCLYKHVLDYSSD